MITDTTGELIQRLDPDAARAVALESAARCGVPFEALNEVRAMAARREMTAAEWLRIALDVGDRWREAA